MKCRTRTYRGDSEMELSYALTPSIDPYDTSGAVEEASALANKNAEAIGSILAHLVERKLMTLEEASRAAGTYADIILLGE